tara:strand:+ start:328 stop:639 length:312 start_codon:yes stop_codon:yes gene_type:complete
MFGGITLFSILAGPLVRARARARARAPKVRHTLRLRLKVRSGFGHQHSLPKFDVAQPSLFIIGDSLRCTLPLLHGPLRSIPNTNTNTDTNTTNTNTNTNTNTL